MSDLRLHLGSGSIKLPLFVNIDHSESHHPDICMNVLFLYEKFPEGSASICFCCHMFEHLRPDDEAPHFLRQCFRVLKSGGTLRLVVPDLKFVTTKYLRGETLRDLLVDETKRYTGNYDTAAARFHYWISESSFEHKFAYDFETLKLMLWDAGFTDVRQMPFGHSDFPELRNLDRFRAESGCYECKKP